MTSAVHALRALSTHLDEVRAVLTAGPPAFFLDFDGTLSAITKHHADAAAVNGAAEVLTQLASLVPVYVVSGRDREDVARRISAPGVTYAGSHGVDVQWADGTKEIFVPVETRADLDGVEAALRERLTDSPITIERKAYAVALHTRGAGPGSTDAATSTVTEVLAEYPDLREGRGKEVHEILPATKWSKGNFVRTALERLASDDTAFVPVVIGDDVTDEDMFQAVDNGLGLRIVVDDGTSDRQTHADYRAADPDEVVLTLRQLAALLGADD